MMLSAVFIVAVCLVSVATSSSTQGPITIPDCINGPLAQYPICDMSRPYAERTRNLVSLMNLTEKISRLSFVQPAIPRLGLGYYTLSTEALHGIVTTYTLSWPAPGEPYSNATLFPEPITQAASFNRRLWTEVGHAIGVEARAFNNVGFAGINIWAPQINVVRDPRWGRGQETPGEDPYTISEYGFAYVNGAQNGEDSRYFLAYTAAKHYHSYDLENWQEYDRFSFEANITLQDVGEFMLPPWRAAIRDAGMTSLMCSYTAVNGVPMCASNLYLNQIARNQWSMSGWVVSDCGAVDNILSGHHYTSTDNQTVSAAMRGGTDIDCWNYYQTNALDALNNGTITVDDIDTALFRQFNPFVRAGWFDDPRIQPYRQYGADRIDSLEHQELARRAGLESIVLLKNIVLTLPIDLSQITSIALIGPNANASLVMAGNYYESNPPYLITVLSALQSAAPKATILYEMGCTISGSSRSGFAAATAAAFKAQLTIFVGGIDGTVEDEGTDRTTIDLPGEQDDLIIALEGSSAHPIIVVVLSGSSIDVSHSRDSAQTGAIIWAGFPGQSGGDVIVAVLTGAYSPAGRLPITLYPADYINQVAMNDMNFHAGMNNPGRTYKYYTGNAVYPFGYGLSYTTFEYHWAETSSTTTSSIYDIAVLMKAAKTYAMTSHGDKVYPDQYRSAYAFTAVNVTVTNTGYVTSDVVVLLFVQPQPEPQQSSSSLYNSTAPFTSLINFDRIFQLQSGQSESIYFAVTLEAISLVNMNGDRVLVPGVYNILVDIDSRLIHRIELIGETTVLDQMLYMTDDDASSVASF